jgi:hypothetical protein
VTIRLSAPALVLGAVVADGADLHRIGYYALVVAVPVAAVAALSAFGAILDGSAAEPLDRLATSLYALALPLLLLAAAARAPLVGDGPPPQIGVTALVACLVLLLVQAALAGVAVLSVPRPALEAD